MAGPTSVVSSLKQAAEIRDKKRARRMRAARGFAEMLAGRLFTNGEGSGLAFTTGTGAGVGNGMIAAALGKTAVSGAGLGLADSLLKSMGHTANVAGVGESGGRTKPVEAKSNHSEGFSLRGYWRRAGVPVPEGPIRKEAASSVPSNWSRAVKAPSPVPHRGDKVSVSEGLEKASAGRKVAVPANDLPWSGRTYLPAHTLPRLSKTDGVRAAGSTESVGSAGSAGPGELSGRKSSAVGKAEGPPVEKRRAVISRSAFIEKIEPAVESAAKALGVSPRLIAAQVVLETGWGRHVVGNNLFGVKAGRVWSGPVRVAPTREDLSRGPVVESAMFRSYGSPIESANDYARLITARYPAAVGVGNDVAAFAAALQAGGYATDPNYAVKLERVAASPEIRMALANAPNDSWSI